MRTRTPLKERILNYVRVLDEDAGGCWIWLSTLNSKGYGRISVERDGVRRRVAAHRVAYEEFVGPIPDGLQIDHLCRVHACVNPSHLEPVTCRENVNRGVRNERNVCYRGHELTPENTYWETNGRRCRACSLAYMHTYRDLHRERLNAADRRRYHERKARQVAPAAALDPNAEGIV